MRDLTELIEAVEASPESTAVLAPEVLQALRSALADRNVVDNIACGLGIDRDWDSAELEWIADELGQVRLHPGGIEREYAADFRTATGRVPNWV